MFYQILKDVYTSNLFETCFMVANDDLKGRTTHFNGFYTHTISGLKIPKTTHSVCSIRSTNSPFITYIP